MQSKGDCPGLQKYGLTLNFFAMSFVRLAARCAIIPRYTSNHLHFRSVLPQRVKFSTAPSLSREDIQSRILQVMKSFEKVDPAKV